jgi:hypothetical protein
MNFFIALLLMAGFVLFILAGFGVTFRQVNFIAFGLACWIMASSLLPAFGIIIVK